MTRTKRFVAKAAKVAWVIARHPFKIAFIVALYTLAFSLFGRFGIPGKFIAIGLGSLLSSVIVLLRLDNVGDASFTTGITLLGAIIGGTCIGDVILYRFYTYDHGFGEGSKSSLFGAIIGALVFAIVSGIVRSGRRSSALRAELEDTVRIAGSVPTIETNESPSKIADGNDKSHR